MEDDWGAAPNPAEGHCPSDSLLRFALVLIILGIRRACASFIKDDLSRREANREVQEPQVPGGVWGLESRARCAGFSVMEIGNRKKRLRFYTSFPD